MKSAIHFSFLFFACLLLSCSAEPPETAAKAPDAPEPEPYLYKPPLPAETGLPSARLKQEALAEAFVSRLSTKAPASVIVMQKEKLVLEEHFADSANSHICTGPLFPPFVGALLGRLYLHESAVPHPVIPLQEFFPESSQATSLAPTGSWHSHDYLQASEKRIAFDALVLQQAGTNAGLAAEEFVFEPLQIDDYQWQGESLCLHPYAVLQLAGLWVNNGRWGNRQLLPASLVQRVLAPAYSAAGTSGERAFGWQYHRLVARGRKQPVLYWQTAGAYLFLLPELEAAVLVQGDQEMLPELWMWLQEYLVPSLAP